jgi:hypothetical protein
MTHAHPSLVETSELALLVAHSRIAPEEIVSYVAPSVHDDGPERFEILSRLLDDAPYWQHLAHLWVFHDQVHRRLATWRRLFLSERPRREELMRPDERETLARLPAQVDVFRGFNHRGGEDGISWTPQRKFAEEFAERWALDLVDRLPRGDMFLARARVPHELIVACFEREAADGVEVVIPVRLAAEVTQIDG